jgi:DNA-binding NarL/FixJ family response regulator
MWISMTSPAASSKTRVLVVDDHRTFAEAMALVISMQSDMSGRAVLSGSEAERAVLEDTPDIVLIDVAAPGLEGLTMAGRLIALVPSIRVMVLSDHDDELLRTRALLAGVHGFVSKFEPIERVLQAIRTARAGEPLAERSDQAAMKLKGKRRRLPHATERQRSERLSPREREILQLMADGLEPPQIATRLGIAPATLRTHLQNMLMKLGVHSKTQALLMAVRQGKVSTRR